MTVTQLAIIGGTGVYDPSMLTGVRDELRETPYGQVRYKLGSYQGREVIFLARHGAGHSLPPHLVNYRANIWALCAAGVQRVIATAAVGTLNPLMHPGDFVLVNQFLDFTRGRISTFFDGGDNGVVHTDVTDPYCPELRALLRVEAQRLGIPLHDGGCYAVMEGPRYETPAEIKALGILGADLVGMTGVPEVVLAREAGLCYSCIAMCTNWAAGISPTRLTHEEVLGVMAANGENLKRLAMAAIAGMPAQRGCECRHVPGKLPGLRLDAD